MKNFIKNNLLKLDKVLNKKITKILFLLLAVFMFLVGFANTSLAIGNCEGACKSAKMERFNGWGDTCTCAVLTEPPHQLDVSIKVDFINSAPRKQGPPNFYWHR